MRIKQLPTLQPSILCSNNLSISYYKQWEKDDIAPQVVFEIFVTGKPPPRDQEKQRADYQQQRADRLAALLRERGIDPNELL